MQSSPLSFRISGQPTRVTNDRESVLYAPALDMAEGDVLSSMEFDEVVKDQRFSKPLPLPLPSQQVSGVLRSNGNLKLSNGSSLVLNSGLLPLPPLGTARGLRNFSFEEISAACQHFPVNQLVSEGIFSTVYRASFGDVFTGSKKLEATVACLRHTDQSSREFVNEVNVVASVQHPQLCKVLGFHAKEGSDQRMLVYERLFHGSLDGLISATSDLHLIDWHARIKVALCAAEGLVFLHEEGPFQTMYHEFSSANIQVDKDFNAKLSGYGCVSRNLEEISYNFAAVTNLSVETLERGLLTPKSNVRSFGVVLLELLTGRKNYDSCFPKEHNIITWSRPFLSDDSRLSLIMDTHLKGRFPLKAARTITDIALKCLHNDPSERPTMRAVAESLQSVQAMKYPYCFPLQEPSAVAGKLMLRSPSLKMVSLIPTPASKISLSLPQTIKPLVSPLRPLVTLPLPPQTSASTLSAEESRIHMLSNLQSPMLPRPGVEGFNWSDCMHAYIHTCT